jgi:hypothetical protein
MSNLKLAGFFVAAALAIGLAGGAEAAPFSYSQLGVEAAGLSDGLVIKAVTRVGVAHRSVRRTARRVNRRHGY